MKIEINLSNGKQNTSFSEVKSGWTSLYTIRPSYARQSHKFTENTFHMSNKLDSTTASLSRPWQVFLGRNRDELLRNLWLRLHSRIVHLTSTVNLKKERK